MGNHVYRERAQSLLPRPPSSSASPTAKTAASRSAPSPTSPSSPATAIETLRRVLRGEKLVNPEDAFACVRSLPHGHVAAVLGTLRKLGLHTLIDRKASRCRDLVLALLVDRVIDAQSKLATARALAPESSVSTLGQTLGLGDLDPHELYAAADSGPNRSPIPVQIDH